MSGCEFLKLGVEKLLITIDELQVKLSVCFSLNLCVGPFSLLMVFVSSAFLFLSPKIKTYELTHDRLLYTKNKTFV